MTAHKQYKIKGDTVEKLRKICPRCGPGTFMADHKDRESCGKCGWTVFKQEENK